MGRRGREGSEVGEIGDGGNGKKATAFSVCCWGGEMGDWDL